MAIVPNATVTVEDLQPPSTLVKIPTLTFHPLNREDDTHKESNQNQAPNHSKSDALTTLTTPTISFAAALMGKGASQDSGPAQSNSSDFDFADLKTPTSIQGSPAILFDVTEQTSMVSKFQHTLTGKFSHGKPTWKKITEFFNLLKLKSVCKLSIFDHKHLYIVCSNRADLNRIWLRLDWIIDGYPMRVFRWEPQFNALKESSIAPVWIRFEGLPLYMFDQKPLLDLSNVIGKPICVDARNLNGSMLNSARVCVELDVSKPLIELIKVGFVNNGSNVIVEEIMVQVYYDIVPPFCCSCWHIGHSKELCKRGTAPSVPYINRSSGKIVTETAVSASAGTALDVALQERGRSCSRRRSRSRIRKYWAPKVATKEPLKEAAKQVEHTQSVMVANSFAALVDVSSHDSGPQNAAQTDLGKPVDKGKENIKHESNTRHYDGNMQVVIRLQDGASSNAIIEAIEQQQEEADHITKGKEKEARMQAEKQNFNVAQTAAQLNGNVASLVHQEAQMDSCVAASKLTDSDPSLSLNPMAKPYTSEQVVSAESDQQGNKDGHISDVQPEVEQIHQISCLSFTKVCRQNTSNAAMRTQNPSNPDVAEQIKVPDQIGLHLQQHTSLHSSSDLIAVAQDILVSNEHQQSSVQVAPAAPDRLDNKASPRKFVAAGSQQINDADSWETVVRKRSKGKTPMHSPSLKPGKRVVSIQESSQELLTIQLKEKNVSCNVEQQRVVEEAILAGVYERNKADADYSQKDPVPTPQSKQPGLQNPTDLVKTVSMQQLEPSSTAPQTVKDEALSKSDAPADAQIAAQQKEQARPVIQNPLQTRTWADQCEQEQNARTLESTNQNRFIDLEQVDILDDVFVPTRPGSAPPSPRIKSKRFVGLDDLALVHSKELSQDTSEHEEQEWSTGYFEEKTYNLRTRIQSRKGYKKGNS